MKEVDYRGGIAEAISKELQAERSCWPDEIEKAYKNRYMEEIGLARKTTMARDNQKIHFRAFTDDGKVIMDVNLGYDYDSIINLTNVVKHHFVNSDTQEVTIKITKEPNG